MHYPLKYRRARTVLYAVALFWLWTWFGSAAFIASLFHSPIHAIIAMYALFAFVLLSIPVFLLALAQLVLNRPAEVHDGVVVPLDGQRKPSGPSPRMQRQAS
ncbi:ABC-type transport system involved in multi-copper enzyme maturation permease subunit [Arthrobacter pigmenti]|uniref:ABC-type transport system involved in multi-copper enzyme maturation permease subunit n=1 Tax=Arthrobacter pigmenti TaxID=271432 RepID=A0A846RKR9_9MICC|nr:hypothetical protein [Arthrobacter pigmenti]NJC23813.1 ABC-type transport system involved in multi-copper enzyme maturation permease subunit [Arthrobacter pigmenti]